MVQTDISQLSQECNQWRDRLHSFRDEFNGLKTQLQTIATKALSKDQLSDLERFQNQLHIQLINIHDLKQAVKAHDRTIHRELYENNNTVSENSYIDHERLFDDYEYLAHTLLELRTELNNFSSKI